MESTVDLMGFLRSLETHQSLSGSKEQIAMALKHDSQSETSTEKDDDVANLAPLATANLFSKGLHLTKVAALLIFNNTKVGFHAIFPVWGSAV